MRLIAMAIYHFDVKMISRSKGRNAVAAAAYRRAAKFYDERCNRTWNYENKPGVIYSEITFPENAPGWSKKTTSEFLWNLAEKIEARINSQTAREVEFSLPVELNQEQSIVLAREFIKDQFISRGMLADWSIHSDNPDNPHVHVMLTTRELTQSGFGNKVREWNNKSLLYVWREKWAEYANFHLQLHQHKVRIDHRSYKDQGIDLIPTIHRGRASEEIHKRGKYSDRKTQFQEIKKENLKKILENLDVLARKIFQSIEQHESVFSDRDLAKAVLTYVDDKAEFDSAMKALTKSKELISLGIGEDGKERFTTRRMFDVENSLQDITEKLQKRNHIRIPKHKINKIVQKYQTKIGKILTPEQRVAINHLVSNSSIACVVGIAGAGKSFAMGAANAVWKGKGLTVYGIAPTGKAARSLQKESKIPSRTIESFRFCVENNIINLTPKDIIVMDEAGMTDSIAMESVLRAVNKAKSKIVLVGEHTQLLPVGPGSAFRAMLERLKLKHEKLEIVYRQNYEWQRKATSEFSKGFTREAIDRYYQNGFVNLISNERQAKQKLVNDWDGLRKLQSRLKPQNLKDYLVMAHRNKDVDELNILLRQKRIDEKEIADGHSVNTSRGVIKISVGDRMLFLLNDKEMDVSNGHFGEIKNIQLNKAGQVISFTTILDDVPGEVITVDPRVYQDFTHGYASTVHKSQGATLDHSFVYLGGRWWNQSLTYVAMSRHRESCHVYVDRNTYKNIEVLKNSVSRKPRKDSVLDYPLAFCERRGINNESLLHKLPTLIREKLKQVRDKIRRKFTQNDPLAMSVNKNHSENHESLTDILKRYVELEIKQSQLVNLAHIVRRESLQASKNYSHQAIDNHNEMQKLAKEVISHTAIQKELEKIKKGKVFKIYELGGFKAIFERFDKNEASAKDFIALVAQIRAKAVVNKVERAHGEKLTSLSSPLIRITS